MTSASLGTQITIPCTNLNVTGGPYAGLQGIEAVSNRVFFSNNDYNKVIEITNTGTFVRNIFPGPGKPFDLVIDDTETFLFIALFSDSIVLKMSINPPYTYTTFCTVPVGGNWFLMYLNGFLYVVSTFRHSITVFNSSAAVVGTYYINTINANFINAVGITYYNTDLYVGYFGPSGGVGAGGVLKIPFNPTTGIVSINSQVRILSNLTVPCEIAMYNDVLVITGQSERNLQFYKLGSTNYQLPYVPYASFFPSNPTCVKVLGNILYISGSSSIFKVDMTPPVISSVSKSGSAITISGTRFTYVIRLFIGTTSCTFSIVNSTTITTTIPGGNSSNDISISDGINTIATTILPSTTPTATSFTPLGAAQNASVSLSGTNLSNMVSVKFGMVNASINLTTGTLVNVSVPTNASTNVSIVLRDSSGVDLFMPGNFTYQNPSATSFTPVAAAQNASLSLSGTNLSNTRFVRFGLVNASINLSSGTMVNVSVPVNASSNVSIVLLDNLGNEVTIPGSFTYQNPSATSFTPLAAAQNASLSLSGTNLSNTRFVRFGLVNASINLSSGTLVNVSVPVNSGNVSIVLRDNVGNEVAMPGNFTYQNPSATSFTPLYGFTNSSLSLSGTNLSNTRFVLFGLVNASINMSSGTLVNVSVPTNASTNVSIVLRDNLGNEVTMPGNFTYIDPKATSFTPLFGAQNASVSLSGTNLSNTVAVRFGTVNASINLSSGTLVNVSVPANASSNVSIVLRDNVGNEVTMPGSFTYQNPSVTSFTPVAGTLNTSVSLSGTNLSNTSYVLFGNASATINLRTGTLVNVSAPANSGNASIVLRDNMGNNVSMPGSFIYQNPSVTSFTPVASAQNASVSLFGTNLSNTRFVRFGLVNASINLSSGTLVNVSVPANASSNVSIVLRDNVGNEVTMPGSFTYQNPSVTSFTPVAGTLNTSVSLSGTNLSNTSYVLFGNASASINLRTGTLVNVSVPVNSGNVSIVLRDNLGNNVSMPGSFTYQNPSVTSFTPVASAQNASVSLSGTNLSNTVAVRFGTVNASINLSSGTLVNVSVPANASSNVSIVLRDNVGNEVTMPGSFTYQNPSVTSFTPVAAAQNASLSLSGTNLSNTRFVRFGLVNASINLSSGTMVNVSVPTNASNNVSIVLLDNLGNEVTMPGSFTYQTPTAISFTPLGAPRNASLSLSGINLSNTRSVRFGLVNASINLSSGTLVNVSVPANASSNVSIVLLDNLGNEVTMPINFTYQNPSVTSFSPIASATNSSMTISGENLSNTSSVLFGLVNASINSITGSSVNVSVPTNSGNVSIVLIDNVGNNASAPGSFTYQNLRITSINPLFGPKNTRINISGEKLDNTTSVKIGGIPTIFTINSSVLINASIPNSSGNASVAVTDDIGNEIIYDGVFKYQNLNISSVFPLYGTTNSSVTLTGSVMTNRTLVKFGDQTATINRTTATSINVSVPANSENVSVYILDNDGNRIDYPELFLYQNPSLEEASPLTGTKNTILSLTGTNLMNISSVKIGSTNTSYFINSSLSINVSVPAGSGNASIQLRDNVSNLISYPSNFVYQNPSFTSFNPPSGTLNTSVTLIGENLSNTSYVTFGTMTAPINQITGTSINVSAPISSSTGTIIIVDTLGNSVTLPTRFVYQNPTATAFRNALNTKVGTTNTSISITGSNLSNTSYVLFGNEQAVINLRTGTLVNVSVPENDGNVSIKVKDNLNNEVILPGNFTYQNPSFTTVRPLDGTNNTSVTLSGNFLSNTSHVLFGEVAAKINLLTANTINVSAPASSNNVSVFVMDKLGNVVTSSDRFSYQNPTIQNISPLVGTKNTSIVLTGQNLTNITTVKVGSTNTTFRINSSTSINVSVPTGTGNVSIQLKDNLFNLIDYPGNFLYQNPAVTSFTITSGTNNTSVTITGTNLSNTSSVLFGTNYATLNHITGTEINVSVPANNVNTNVSIFLRDNVSNLLTLPGNFTYQNSSVTLVAPLSGTTNTVITITGFNLSNTSFVNIQGYSVPFTVNTSRSLSATVNASSGNASIVVIDNLGNNASFSGNFTYVNPTVGNYQPVSGTKNTSVTITGTNMLNTSYVYFGEVNASINLRTPTSINVSAPENEGNVSITVTDKFENDLVLPGNFTYQNLSVTEFNPPTGTFNTSVSLSGYNLSNVRVVRFGTTNASINFSSGTLVNVSAPAKPDGTFSIFLRDHLGNEVVMPEEFTYQNPSVTDFNVSVGTKNTSVTITGSNLFNTSFVRFGLVNASINLITDTLVNVSAPANSGNVSIVVRDNLGNNVSAPGNFVFQNPTITRMTPTTGSLNTQVTINGSNLSDMIFVQFGGTNATIVSNTSTAVQAIAPDRSGNVSVVLIDSLENNIRVPGNFAYQNTTVSGFAPSVGIRNTPIVVTGTFLNNISYVQFGTVNASVRSKTATTLNVSAPVNTGNVSLILVDLLGNNITAPGSFSYQYPSFTSIEPEEGTTNTVLKITGVNLGNTKSVKIGTTTITKFISKTSTEINVSVLKSPLVTTGNVSVVLIDQSGLNTSYNGNFAYKNPSITSVTPLFGFFQTPVTINGANLSNTSYVKFGTAFAPIQSKTNASISVLAPSVTGKATITVGDIFKNVITHSVPFLYETATITSLTPPSGPKNTLLMITGTNLSNISYANFGNISTEVEINSSISIQTTVPDSTGTVTFSLVDNIGKITTYSKKFAFTTTTISSMSASGVPKGTMQIKGTNLINTSIVNFSNVSAPFKAYSTYINATIPLGYGNVSVEVIDRSGNSYMAPGSFLFKTPGITQISSDSSPVNSTITIYGMNLINTSYVSFGNVSTKKLTKTANSINVSVPLGYGNVSLVITDIYGNNTSFARDFIYQNTFISSVTPRISPPKSNIAIEGGYLSNTSSVLFGTQNTSFTIVSSSLINASVPASSGNVSLSVRDNISNLTTYNELFTYQVMTIQDFNPKIGLKNAKILVEGTEFSAVENVQLGNTSVDFTIISNYQIEIVVPEISGSNYLTIKDEYNNSVTSTQSFTRKNPTITAVDKVSGLIGETFTIYGTELGDMKYVVFDKEQAVDIVVTETEINCTIPFGLGEVAIQISDNFRNTLTVPVTFTYIQNVPEANLILENAPSFTTIDNDNNIYTSNGTIVNKTTNTDGTSTTTLFYTNTRLITGIALDKDILYMCEYEFYDIARYNTKTRVKLSYIIDPADRVQPNIIKVYKNKLYTICNADPDTTDPDYLYVFDLSTNAVYKKDLLSAYTVQGLALYNDTIYLSAVIKNSPALGRIYSTQLNGVVINESLITGLDNPIDLTFINDLLAIDGRSVILYNINNVTTPLATYQSSPTSEYNSVFTGTDGAGNNVIYMTNTTTNTIETVPAPSALTNDVLATQITPNSGSENSHIVIEGQNFLNSTNTPRIKKVMFGATEATQLNIISNTVLYCDAPYGGGYTAIQLIDMSDVTISTLLYFTYQKPTILDSYPKQGLEGEKMYIYGNYMNLVDKVLIGPIEAPFVLIRRDYIRVTIPPGSGTHPITLIDNLQNTITNQAFTYTYYVFNSTICFPAGTLVHTDQGILPIQMIVPGLHSLNQDGIVAITDTYSMDKELVCIEKDALGKNRPCERTLISPRHKLYYKGKMKPAYRFVGKPGISFVPYRREKLYNVLLENYGVMRIHGLICETLHPKNPVAKYYRLKLTEQ